MILLLDSLLLFNSCLIPRKCCIVVFFISVGSKQVKERRINAATDYSYQTFKRQ